MTPSQIEAHQRHVRFQRAIALRAAALSPRQEKPTYSIPNTPFGVPKHEPRLPPIRMEVYYRCMWFYDLVHAPLPRPKALLSIAQIQAAVCSHFNVDLNDLLSDRRTRTIMPARQIGYYLAKKLTRRSLPEIGRRFNRDHTSVLHGIREIERKRGCDEWTEENLRVLAAELGGKI